MYYIYRTRRKRKQRKMMENMSKQQVMPSHKKYSPKRWVVERTNSWHNRFKEALSQDAKRKQIIYLGLVHTVMKSSFTERQFWDRLLNQAHKLQIVLLFFLLKKRR